MSQLTLSISQLSAYNFIRRPRPSASSRPIGKGEASGGLRVTPQEGFATHLRVCTILKISPRPKPFGTSENLQAEKSACGRRMRIDKMEKLYKLYSTYSKVDYEKVAYFLQWSSIIIKFVQRESPIDIK